jgi:hypothetical protein
MLARTSLVSYTQHCSRQQGTSATAAELLPNMTELTLFAGIHNVHYLNSQYLSGYHLYGTTSAGQLKMF